MQRPAATLDAYNGCLIGSKFLQNYIPVPNLNDGMGWLVICLSGTKVTCGK